MPAGSVLIYTSNFYHGGGANIGYIGAAVKFMTDQTDLKVIHALGTISGGEADVNFN